jgi:hypothetical protein
MGAVRARARAPYAHTHRQVDHAAHAEADAGLQHVEGAHDVVVEHFVRRVVRRVRDGSHVDDGVRREAGDAGVHDRRVLQVALHVHGREGVARRGRVVDAAHEVHADDLVAARAEGGHHVLSNFPLATRDEDAHFPHAARR